VTERRSTCRGVYHYVLKSLLPCYLDK